MGPFGQVSGEQFFVVLGALSTLGGIAIGLKKVRSEMVEVARETATTVVYAAIDRHVQVKHEPVMEILTEIQIGIARVEAKLAERQSALCERVEAIEDRCETHKERRATKRERDGDDKNQ